MTKKEYMKLTIKTVELKHRTMIVACGGHPCFRRRFWFRADWV